MNLVVHWTTPASSQMLKNTVSGPINYVAHSLRITPDIIIRATCFIYIGGSLYPDDIIIRHSDVRNWI